MRCLVMLLCASTFLCARIQTPEPAIDLTPLVATAPSILRAVVVSSSVPENFFQYPAVARLKVERWYRGGDREGATIRYRVMGMIGHDCIDFKAGTRWLIFATGPTEDLQLVDDCYGAVAVSPRMAPLSNAVDARLQLEADFVAGLNDPDPDVRIVSLQRLGGLKSPSSRAALQGVIDGGTGVERLWAIFAAIRTADPSVLPLAHEVFDSGRQDMPLAYLAFELTEMRERSAVPALLEIARSSKFVPARSRAIEALGKNPAALEIAREIAAALSDRELSVQFSALNAIEMITSEPACRAPVSGTDRAIRSQVSMCRAWWNRYGRRIYSQ